MSSIRPSRQQLIRPRGNVAHDGWNGHDTYAGGQHETGYHSQLDALSPDGHHTGMIDQLALPHAEYFGS